MTNNNEREQLAISNMMRDEDSRNIIWNHLQYCGIFKSTFDPDPIAHAYRAGKRDAGLQLERQLKESAFDGYLKMIQENNNG